MFNVPNSATEMTDWGKHMIHLFIPSASNNFNSESKFILTVIQGFFFTQIGEGKHTAMFKSFG